MERELNDLIEVCLIEENRESFSIAEVNEGDF